MRPIYTLLKLLLWETEKSKDFYGLCIEINALHSSHLITLIEKHALRLTLTHNKPRSIFFKFYWGLILNPKTGYWWKEGVKRPRKRFLKHLIRKYQSA